MKNWKFKSVGWGMMVLLVAGLAGCPVPEQDDGKAIQKAAAASEALDLTIGGAGGAVNNTVAGAIADKMYRMGVEAAKVDVNPADGLEGQWPVDFTVDFDATNPQGADLFPGATGIIHVTGTALIAAAGGQGLTLTADPLRVTFITDVTLTVPETGVSASYAQDAFVDYAASAHFSIALPAVFNMTLTLTSDIQDLMVTLYHPEEGGFSAELDSSGSTVFLFSDDNVLDGVFGTVDYQVNKTTSLTWTQFMREMYAAVEVVMDTTVDPEVNQIAVTINNSHYGPMDPAEFWDEYSQEILAMIKALFN